MLKYPQSGGRKVSLSVMGICLVRFDTSFEGIRAHGEGSRVYNMVNFWFKSPIPGPASETEMESLSSLSGK